MTPARSARPGPPNGGPRPRAAAPLAIGQLSLRNRIVGTAHARGLVENGLPLPDDAEYWRRLAAGGAAMLTVGGTAVSPESTYRRGNLTEAWRPEAVPGMAARAHAIRAEGAVAACQLVHLGRETLGAETWFHPVAPSSVRSPREPTRPRSMTDGDTDAMVEAFRISAANAEQAGFQVVELHAAHGYLLGQFLSAHTNRRADAASALERLDVIVRIAAAIRESAGDLVLGVRLSTGGGQEAGLTLDGLCELLPHVSLLFDYVSVTVGVRGTYVRDMATDSPPLLGDIERIRSLVDGPLVVAQSFRAGPSIERALAAGADAVGVARALIADADFPAKLLSGRAAAIRPCVACNEDCRAFDPALLCSVNPDLAPAGANRRPAAPMLVSSFARGPSGPTAIVGAGPAGLECALSLARGGHPEVVIFDEHDHLGGQLAVAASAPNRAGWRALVEFYETALTGSDGVKLCLGVRAGPAQLEGYEQVVIAAGSEELLPAIPGAESAVSASAAIDAGPARFATGSRVVIVDDGFGWWPCASAMEVALRAGARSVTVVTPSASFGASLPAEGRTQLFERLRREPIEIRPLQALTAVGRGHADIRNVLSDAIDRIEADVVVIVGERCARDWTSLPPSAAAVWVIGDAVTPRRAAHAIAEGHAVAEDVLSARASHPVASAAGSIGQFSSKGPCR